MSLLGGEGLAQLALLNHDRAQVTAQALKALPSVTFLNKTYVNEFTILLPTDARPVVRALADRQVLGGVALGRLYPEASELHQGLLITATECTTDEDIAALVAALKENLA